MNKLQSYTQESFRWIVRTFCKKYDTSVLGDLGGGVGKGGGGGGSIREAGGSFGKLGAAREEEYFHNLQQRLLIALKEKLDQENQLRLNEIDRHQKAIKDNSNLAREIQTKLKNCATPK
ncbi:hypothetical protein HUJ04_006494 [Dendroctonus ponderosae]|nr:hypothetical protein HUJ04_006494 [Dendroctonus ponderosae]KAH1012656.1 hypothetical protein HUJ05_011775 [Dendroctonus ponderosae]